MYFFEKKSYNLPQGTDKAIEEFVNKHPQDFENKSHFVRCAIIAFFREQRKKGKYISEAIK